MISETFLSIYGLEKSFHQQFNDSHVFIYQRATGHRSYYAIPRENSKEHARKIKKSYANFNLKGMTEWNIRSEVEKFQAISTLLSFHAETEGEKVKEQHLIPSVYFKQFSYRNSVNTYLTAVCNAKTGEILLATEKTFCTAKIGYKFYNGATEALFSATEHDYGQILQKINHKDNFKLTDGEKLKLSIFMASFNERFPYNDETIVDPERIKNPDQYGRRISHTVPQLATNLLTRKWVWGITKEPLVTSQHPLFILETLGDDQILNLKVPRGLHYNYPVFYFPVSSNIVLFLITAKYGQLLPAGLKTNSRDGIALKKLILHSNDQDIFNLDNLDGIENFAREINLHTLINSAFYHDPAIVFYNPLTLPFKEYVSSNNKLGTGWDSRFHTAHRKNKRLEFFDRVPSIKNGFMQSEILDSISTSYWNELKKRRVRF